MGILKGEIVNCLPGKGFPAVSVTGKKCDLMCAHCLGHHLCGMIFADNPEKLYEEAKIVKSTNGNGLLISGGSDINGKVPLFRYASTIRKIVELGLSINVHPGIIGREDADLLVSSGVDYFSVDVHQDPDVIRKVFNLKGPEIYNDTMDAIIGAGGTVIPHLTVGLSFKDLIESAELVKDKGLKNVVILALVPTKGTIFENYRISEDEIIDSIEAVMKMDLNVTLGCMRDRRMRKVERRCIELGINKIANMSKETEKWAESEGYKIIRTNKCCCFPLE
jgi:hypothetical protein